MTPDRTELLTLATGVLVMMIVLAVLKHAARGRAHAAKRAQLRLAERASKEP